MSELKLAISNIAWDKADDEAVYAAMQQALPGWKLPPPVFSRNIRMKT